MKLSRGTKWAAVVAAAAIALGGYITYNAEFSETAHIKHRCLHVWAQTQRDKSAMDTLFEQHPLDGETVIPQWLDAASDLHHFLTENPAASSTQRSRSRWTTICTRRTRSAQAPSAE